MSTEQPALLPIGHQIESHSRTYEVVAIVPHTRKDGKPTWLYRYRGLCRHPQCSEIVEFDQSYLWIADFKGHNCEAHFGWYDRGAATKACRAGVKAFYAALSPEETAERKAMRMANLTKANEAITPEQRAERSRRSAETYRQNWAKLSPAERTAIQKKRAAGKKKKRK